jgi:hypothetical protein
MLYNVAFITDRVTLSTTEEAEDSTDAHNRGLATILRELGLNLIPMRYNIHVEEV